jgi:O-acetyl-ADP-ribose deacetylase
MCLTGLFRSRLSIAQASRLSDQTSPQHRSIINSSSVPSPHSKKKMDFLTEADIPTIVSLYQRQKLDREAAAQHEASHDLNRRICLVKYDITLLQLDAIVNAANESLLGGGGVDGAIHRAAGPQLFDECETLRGCPTGGAKITKAYRLPARKVIHAVGPMYSLERRRGLETGESGREQRLLRSCYRQSLDLCDEHGLESIAFSCLSTGIYGYPSRLAAEAALSEVRSFFEQGNGKNIKTVVFCTFLPKDQDAYIQAIPYVYR